MFCVINKEQISSIVDQFYLSSKLEDAHPPLRVSKMSVYSKTTIFYDYSDFIDEDDFINEDCAADYELAYFLTDSYLPDNFSIMPTAIITSNDVDAGTTLEWAPSKPVFITSKAGCVKFYESFAAYIESSSENCEDEHGCKQIYNLDFVICFRNLYESVDTTAINLDFNDTHVYNPLFTPENFNSRRRSVSTFNAIFKF